MRAGAAAAGGRRDPDRQDERLRVLDVLGLDNPLFGSTLNPWDRDAHAGGSSGGEACAVATGMSAFGLGSDLGGSIRAPAHFCGVYGLRTGRGTMPFAAHHPLPASPGVRTFGTLGPLARTLDDLELVLSVLAPDAPPPCAVERVAVFEDDGLQPVARCAARRCGPRPRRSTP